MMKTENKIIRMFLENRKSKTIREISRKIKSDYRITHTATKKLLDKNILLSKRVGKSILCELNKDYFAYEIYLAESQRRDSLLKNSDLKQMYREIMEKVSTSFFVFLVFGSFAKGKAKINSDIDLVFISNETGFEKKIINILSLTPLKTHAFVFSEKEFIRMKNSNKSNVIKEALEINIILYGIPSFYRLKNAK
ncbi:hypothetical protein GF327_01645 [Candidatus Woesearchaeota archaeon]|nr:hypothetical protein [Candidatus Woesearchaeota archaeon]